MFLSPFELDKNFNATLQSILCDHYIVPTPYPAFYQKSGRFSHQCGPIMDLNTKNETST